MKPVIIFVVLASMQSCSAISQVEETENYLSHLFADLWLVGSDVVNIIWRDCSKKIIDGKDVIEHKYYYPKFMRCMKKKTLRALDRTLNMDIIPIAEGVDLVKFELVDRAGNMMTRNNSSSWNETDLDQEAWHTLAIQRLAKVLSTHVVKFELPDVKAEQRGRRRHHMLTMMMFGIVSIGMVMVPMGFQFLAVLGGKALVLAKMALILASIQGLKKIASSPLNYEFYHYPYEHFNRRSNEALLTKNLRGIQDLINEKPENRQFADSFSIDPSTVDPIVDLTTHKGEVQATYSLELPYNRLNFLTPYNIVPT